MLPGVVDVVVKVGGALLAQPPAFSSVLATVAAAARERHLLIVPGGGPFTDVVRNIDPALRPSEEAAHWMAILGMDQYAYLIADRLTDAAVVETPPTVAAALDAGQLPVLAPSRWLSRVDPLPHSWDVTSDSIAAWISGELSARLLVLVKPANATGDRLVDDYFQRALPPGTDVRIVSADTLTPSHLAL
jgi:dihydroneopterin aldolase